MTKQRMGCVMKARLFWRSCFIQSLWSFENMQGLGFGFCVEPWLRERWGGSPREEILALERNCEQFNTQPYMVGLVAGMACSLEASPRPRTLRTVRG